MRLLMPEHDLISMWQTRNMGSPGGGPFTFDESTTDFGDPVANALIGWHEGNCHWNIGSLLNIPIGPWSKERDTNISFNHWALDTTAAVTWLDPKIGFEVSSAAGFTFNSENPDTDYTTGTEFHIEGSLVQHLSKKLAVVGRMRVYDLDSMRPHQLVDFTGRCTGSKKLLIAYCVSRRLNPCSITCTVCCARCMSSTSLC
jgi:hypothetical protein